MAIFSTRSSSQRSQDAARKSNVPVDSVETLRTRARQRLIGAVVLVVLGVLGFTLLLDTQPRPIPSDIEIIIPDKDKVERLTMPAVSAIPVAPVPAGHAVASAAVPPVQDPVSLSSGEALPSSRPPAADAAQAAPRTDIRTEIQPESRVEKKVDKLAEKKPEAAAPAKPVAVDDGAKARAILEGKELAKESAKEPAKAAMEATDGIGRFVVQVGAFADGTKAHDVRLKLERAGLKTYTHVAQTKEGARTRVRVGPFASRAEAEKAAAKIKKIDLPAAILTL